MVDLMLKDLNLAMDAASKVGLDIEMGALARRLYMEHQAAGHGRCATPQTIHARATHPRSDITRPVSSGGLRACLQPRLLMHHGKVH